MYLKSLAIRGFKSFAKKTIMEFEPGITIIVGPNGSGKSNIADAVMWVLGEQSPTSLRGNRMEDVIFSGSSSTRPVSTAEVALTLDNSKNDFPLEYSEINICRNVVRGGDSEYRLNSHSCRLLDIQELLSDAGVGRTLNSVVSQGQLEEVLTCRPEERRDFIEEAGGLLKYRKRRDKALRRLERMDEELVRISDVIREVKRQLRPLLRQADRLEQYRVLNRELGQARLRLDVARLRQMQREWQKHQKGQDERKGRLDALEEELSGSERQIEELEKDSEDWQLEEDRLRDRLYSLVSLDEQLKATYPAWGERRDPPDTRPSGEGPGLGETVEKIRFLEQKKDELSKQARNTRAQVEELGEETLGLKRELEGMTREIAGIEARLEVLRSAGGGDGSAAERRLRQVEHELSRLEADRGPSRERVARSEDTVAAVRGDLLAVEEEKNGLWDRRAETAERMLEMEREQAMLVARLDLISRLDTDGWGIARTTATLLENDPTSGGLSGMLAGSLKIDEGYEQAILGYIGPWAYGVVARDTNAVRSALDCLKLEEYGQVLFFRSHDGPPSSRGRSSDHHPESAVRARGLVEASPLFSDALDALLEGVFITEDLDSAFELASRHPDLVFVSPEGDVVSGGTLIKGGSTEVNQAQMDAARTRRDQLEDSLAECMREIEGLKLEWHAQDLREKELVARAETEVGRLVEAEEELREALRLLASNEARFSAASEEIEYWRCSSEEGAQRLEPGETETRLAGLREKEEQLNGELENGQMRLEKLLDVLMRQEAELAGLRSELEVNRSIDKELRCPSGLSERDTGAQAYPGLIDRLEGLHSRLLEQVGRERERTRKRIEDGHEKTRSAAGELKDLRERSAEIRRRHDGLLEEVHERDLSRAELKLKVEQLVERVVDGHKVPLEFALKQYADEAPDPELEATVEKLSAKLEHIGPVNPEAITEKETLKERFDFLKEQLDDVEKAKTQLAKVVKKIDREIKEKFALTVEEVNEHFRQMFSFLFPNGKAEIKLTDPDDLLHSGIEIMAQPEGKKLRRISLLSGGETSLTAIAFFFALFKVRPSPFYFLDEVEAALDDVNLHRFLDLVREFRDESQLILITHQKRSMEIADILYGVTMHGDGVSRVVSQKVAS